MSMHSRWSWDNADKPRKPRLTKAQRAKIAADKRAGKGKTWQATPGPRDSTTRTRAETNQPAKADPGRTPPWEDAAPAGLQAHPDSPTPG